MECEFIFACRQLVCVDINYIRLESGCGESHYEKTGTECTYRLVASVTHALPATCILVVNVNFFN